jgi:hypothetical protein
MDEGCKEEGLWTFGAGDFGGSTRLGGELNKV